MLASCRWLTVLTIFVALPASLCAAPPEPELADFWLTVQARQRLQDDGLLAPWNLGVRVRGRVAILWGPAPSVELGLLAEARVRTMIELIDVRNELVVMPEEASQAVAPPVERPLFLPEKGPPPLPEGPRRLLHRNPGSVWDAASAKR